MPSNNLVFHRTCVELRIDPAAERERLCAALTLFRVEGRHTLTSQH
jgi:hypothetical protein